MAGARESVAFGGITIRYRAPASKTRIACCDTRHQVRPPLRLIGHGHAGLSRPRTTRRVTNGLSEPIAEATHRLYVPIATERLKQLPEPPHVNVDCSVASFYVLRPGAAQQLISA